MISIFCFLVFVTSRDFFFWVSIFNAKGGNADKEVKTTLTVTTVQHRKRKPFDGASTNFFASCSAFLGSCSPKLDQATRLFSQTLKRRVSLESRSRFDEFDVDKLFFLNQKFSTKSFDAKTTSFVLGFLELSPFQKCNHSAPRALCATTELVRRATQVRKKHEWFQSPFENFLKPLWRKKNCSQVLGPSEPPRFHKLLQRHPHNTLGYPKSSGDSPAGYSFRLSQKFPNAFSKNNVSFLKQKHFSSLSGSRELPYLKTSQTLLHWNSSSLRKLRSNFSQKVCPRDSAKTL